MTIDINNEINDIKANELTSSLNSMMNDVSLALSISLPSHNSSNRWEMYFNNGHTLRVEIERKNGELRRNISYRDEFGVNRSYISLQEALNIHKYTREVEDMIKRFFKDPSKPLNSYMSAEFTPQSISKPLRQYNENNIEERNKIIKNHSLRNAVETEFDYR